LEHFVWGWSLPWKGSFLDDRLSRNRRPFASHSSLSPPLWSTSEVSETLRGQVAYFRCQLSQTLLTDFCFQGAGCPAGCFEKTNEDSSRHLSRAPFSFELQHGPAEEVSLFDSFFSLCFTKIFSRQLRPQFRPVYRRNV